MEDNDFGFPGMSCLFLFDVIDFLIFFLEGFLMLVHQKVIEIHGGQFFSLKLVITKLVFKFDIMVVDADCRSFFLLTTSQDIQVSGRSLIVTLRLPLKRVHFHCFPSSFHFCNGISLFDTGFDSTDLLNKIGYVCLTTQITTSR